MGGGLHQEQCFGLGRYNYGYEHKRRYKPQDEAFCKAKTAKLY